LLTFGISLLDAEAGAGTTGDEFGCSPTVEAPGPSTNDWPTEIR
jgi:hypothetical protein